MASFRDQVLLGLGDPASLAAALLAPGDTVGLRVRTMLAATYDLSAARLDQVRAVAVREVALERALFPVSRRSGAWSQTVPSFTRTEMNLDVPLPGSPLWIDMLARLDATVVTEVDPAGAVSVLTQEFDTFTTLDEFRARFTFIDLDGFLARHHISTVEELRAAFDYLVTEVQLRKPGAVRPERPGQHPRRPGDPRGGGVRCDRSGRGTARHPVGTGCDAGSPQPGTDHPCRSRRRRRTRPPSSSPPPASAPGSAPPMSRGSSPARAWSASS